MPADAKGCCPAIGPLNGTTAGKREWILNSVADWGYPYYDYAAYGNGCWRWDGWQWINVCYGYGGYNYGY